MNTASNEWITHDGQRVPDGLAPDDRVEVRFRDGEQDTDVVSRFEWAHHPGIVGNSADILEYRLIHG